jgi:hypothetical protein
MAYFFFSYAREDWDGTMERFYEELVKEVKDRGEPGGGFLDQGDVELGEDWPEAMSEALANCQVFVYVHSYRYFGSDYCGKEWTVFRNRIMRYVSSCEKKMRPRLMLPILWFPPTRLQLPPVAAQAQFKHKLLGETYAQQGLRHLRRLRSNYKKAYYDFLNAFTKTLLAVGKKWPLAADVSIPSIRSVESAWRNTSSPPGVAQSALVDQVTTRLRVPSGPGHALFFYIAKPHHDLSSPIEMRTDDEIWGQEWCPYYPPPPLERVSSIVQKAVSDMNIVCHHFGAQHNLADLIEAAQRNNNIVVIVIDMRSVSLPYYGDILAKCDGRDFLNCAVLMAWNKNDQASENEIESLKKKIQEEVFKVKFANRASNYYWDPIQSREELVSAVIQAVNGAHSKISKFLPVQRAEAAQGVTTPIFPHPPAI